MLFENVDAQKKGLNQVIMRDNLTIIIMVSNALKRRRTVRANKVNKLIYVLNSLGPFIRLIANATSESR